MSTSTYHVASVPNAEAGPRLTDAQIVAIIETWNTPPKGYPDNHRLYYTSREKGWAYLTAEGREVTPDPEMLAEQQARLHAWSSAAAASIMEKVLS